MSESLLVKLFDKDQVVLGGLAVRLAEMQFDSVLGHKGPTAQFALIQRAATVVVVVFRELRAAQSLSVHPADNLPLQEIDGELGEVLQGEPQMGL